MQKCGIFAKFSFIGRKNCFLIKNLYFTDGFATMEKMWVGSSVG